MTAMEVPDPAPTDWHGMVYTPGGTDPEDGVFGATDLLGRIRTAARARLVSPWAVLGCALARVVAATPPHYVLPAVIGSQASINLAVALVGGSGTGKSLANSCTSDLLLVDADVHEIGPGTGEGIITTFLHWNADHTRLVMVGSPNAYLYADEIGQIDAVGSRNGATFGPVIRSMVTGTSVSTTNADPARRRHLAKHSYRLAIVAGVQPALASVLLDDEDAGTPQRWLWLPADDPSIPDEEPGWPGEVAWTVPPPERPPVLGGHVEFTLPPGAARLVKGEHRKRQRGGGEALDGHALLTRMKVAAALALLHGGCVITSQCWMVSNWIMEKSAETRGLCESAIALAREAEHRSRGRMDAARAAGAREADGDRNAKLARLLHRTVASGTEGHANSKHEPGDGCTRRCLTFALRNHPAADKDAVIAAAADLDWITEEGGRWWPGGSRPAEEQ